MFGDDAGIRAGVPIAEYAFATNPLDASGLTAKRLES
jgi:hypothetical protein